MSRENWYVPPGLQLTQLARAFVEGRHCHYVRRINQDGVVIELKLIETGASFLIKGDDFAKTVEDILECRRRDEENSIMKQRELLVERHSSQLKESSIEWDEFRREMLTIDMPGRNSMVVYIRGDKITISCHGSAISVQPRAANQIDIAMIDPYEKD